MRLLFTAIGLYFSLTTASIHRKPRVHSLSSCTFQQEGKCRARPGFSYVEICAAGWWQAMARGAFRCVAETMLPLNSSDASLSRASVGWRQSSITSVSDAVTSSPTTPLAESISSVVVSTAPTAPANSSFPFTHSTGNAYCRRMSLPEREDQWGRATYTFGGRMASTYDADTTSIFRCNAAPPSDGYFVAFWTQYRAGSISQPQPLNCNHSVRLTNPRLDRTATAFVIDRCASCVGVGRKVNDPTTPDCLVNGATVDLSPDLWNFLYAGAPPSVYDIEYEGDVYAGWDADPSPLTALSDGECAC